MTAAAPRSRTRFTTTDPRKPAPPVTMTRLSRQNAWLSGHSRFTTYSPRGLRPRTPSTLARGDPDPAPLTWLSRCAPSRPARVFAAWQIGQDEVPHVSYERLHVEPGDGGP